MDREKNLKYIITLFITGILFGSILDGQPVQKAANDSLTLKEIITTAVSNHPSVSIAEEAINSADARIRLAKTGYYPEIDANASFSNIGPVTKLSIPNMGSFQLYPENNYSAAINYRQVVYDFGRTRQNIEVEKEGKSIGEQAVEQVKQKISLLAVNNYYTLVYLQSAILIKDEQLKALNEHLDHITKMMETGSATEYQVLATKVRISTVESQKVDLQASMEAQQSFLNSLMGSNADDHPVVKKDLTAEASVVQGDSLLPFALKNRDEVIMNEKRTSLAELRYDMMKLQNKPLLSFMATGGAKNGYVPELGELKPNYVVGLGLRIPIFDGMKNKYNLAQAKSAVTSSAYETENTKRTVTNELKESQAYMSAAEQKINQFSLQLLQAQKAYSLAVTSFNSGVITNLDLLDANTAVSESRLMLLRAQIDYAASIYKFRAALGERLY
jgi:outer membrane protein TolC